MSSDGLTLTELIDASGSLVRDARRREGHARAELLDKATQLRGRAEDLLLEGAHPEVAGLLNDALTSLVLLARAAQAADESRAEERLEQAELFLKAARQTADSA